MFVIDISLIRIWTRSNAESFISPRDFNGTAMSKQDVIDLVLLLFPDATAWLAKDKYQRVVWCEPSIKKGM
jgi:hypothetical protein